MLHAVRKVVQLLVQNSQGRLPHVESNLLSNPVVQIVLNHVVQINRLNYINFKAPLKRGVFCILEEILKSRNKGFFIKSCLHLMKMSYNL